MALSLRDIAAIVSDHANMDIVCGFENHGIGM